MNAAEPPQSRRSSRKVAAWVAAGSALSLTAAFFVGRAASPPRPEPAVEKAEPPAETSAALPVPAPPAGPADASVSAKISRTELVDLGTGPADAGPPAVAVLRVQVTEGEGGPGRAGAEVVAEESLGLGRPPVQWRTKTSGAGWAELVLPYGTYQLWLEREGVEREPFRVTVESQSVQKALVIHEPGVLEGAVLDDRGAPVKDAVVRIQPVREGKEAVRSDERGAFQLKLPPDVYALEVGAAGFSSLRRAGIQILATRRRQESFVLDALDASLTLELRCGAAPCADAEVFIEWPNGTRTGRAGRNGIVTLQELPARNVFVRAAWNRGTPEGRVAQGTVRLRSKQRTSLSLELAAPPVPEPAVPAEP